MHFALLAYWRNCLNMIKRDYTKLKALYVITKHSICFNIKDIFSLFPSNYSTTYFPRSTWRLPERDLLQFFLPAAQPRVSKHQRKENKGAKAPRAAEPTAAPADGNVAVGSHGEYVPTLTAAVAGCVNAAVSKAAWWPWPLTFDLESGVRVTCDVGYFCANFSLPWPLCSRLRPDVRDRQTDRRQTASSLNASAY